MSYAVQADTFTPTISVGRVNARGDAFTADKEDGTGMTLMAVADLARKHYDGELSVNFNAAGVRLTVTVEPIEDSHG